MKLKTSSKAAFGFGALGKDIVYMLIASYMLYYYNVVLGMSSVFIGTVMMAARVFDAFNDPIMGIIVAKTHTKHGKFRPWILTGTILNAVIIYALYATPDNISDSGAKIWLTVFYLLWGITYTMMDIPFWSMIPAITKPGKDREELTSIARSCSGIGDAIPTVLTMVVVPILSGSSVIADYKIGFKYWALIIAVFFVISEVVFYIFVPEQEEEEKKEESVSIKEMFASLLRNDQAMTVVVSIIFVYTALNIVGNLILYFFQFDIGNTDAYSVFTAVCFAAQVVIMMIFPLFRKKMKKIQLYMTGFFVQILGFVIILIMASTRMYGEHWQLLLIPGAMVYAGYGILNVLLTIFLSDSVDYGEVKNGRREESVIFSMQTFTVKLASGLAVFIAGLVIDWISLDQAAAAQTAETLTGLRISMTIPSVILLIIGMLIFRKFYKLDDDKMDEITAKLDR